MIALDILHDPICPWCWIGKTYLDRALEARPEHPFRIGWHPFQLNPGMPPEGMDRAEYLEWKFGGKTQAAEAYAVIDKAARAAGFEIEWEKIPRTPNTLNAHRVVHWAGLEGCQTRIVDRLFRAFFLESRDLGDHATLVEIADASCLDGEMVARLLATDADRDDIAARDADAREKGVRGVPTFVLANSQMVYGAQPPAMWAQLIDGLAQAAEAEE